MRPSLRLRLIPALAFCLTTSFASATPFDFSYLFSSGETFSGTFDGTISGVDPDLVTVDQLLTATYTGVGVNPAGPITFQLSLLGALVSFSGNTMDFISVSPDFLNMGGFQLLNNGPNFGGPTEIISDPNFNFVENRSSFDAQAWSLSYVSSVPEPSSIALFALGLAGLYSQRKKLRNVGQTDR